jgi:hypothetical protein
MVDLSAYTIPIIEFYGKHPEYQEIFVPSLMEFLSDKKCSTSNQLFQMAQMVKLHIIR